MIGGEKHQARRNKDLNRILTKKKMGHRHNTVPARFNTDKNDFVRKLQKKTDRQTATNNKKTNK